MKNYELNTDQPEIVALNCLTFLASEPDRFGRFLALTGLQPGDVADQAEKSDFLASVLDYLLADERLLLEFAAEERIDPQKIFLLRRKLPGASSI
jgi:hypothetical protein